MTLTLKRADVPIRKPQFSGGRIEEAAQLYASDWSLNRLGHKFGMDPKTVKGDSADEAPDLCPSSAFGPDDV